MIHSSYNIDWDNIKIYYTAWALSMDSTKELISAGKMSHNTSHLWQHLLESGISSQKTVKTDNFLKLHLEDSNQTFSHWHSDNIIKTRSLCTGTGSKVSIDKTPTELQCMHYHCYYVKYYNLLCICMINMRQVLAWMVSSLFYPCSTPSHSGHITDLITITVPGKQAATDLLSIIRVKHAYHQITSQSLTNSDSLFMNQLMSLYISRGPKCF